MKRYSVDKVILPAITLESLGLSTTTDQVYSVFLDTINEKGIEIKRVKEGDVIEFDSVSFDFLFPTAVESFKYSKASAPELVMDISYGDDSVMILNNITPKIQKYIASSPNRSTPPLPSVALTKEGRLVGGSVGSLAEDDSARSDALIVFNNASPDNLAAELMDKLRPENLIYSKSLSNTSSKSATSKNEKPDPLFYLMDDHRFNIKEKGTIKIVSNGSLLEIKE